MQRICAYYLKRHAHNHSHKLVFLKQISNPQVAFAVRVKQLVNLDEAVTTTLEMKSYVDQRRINSCVANVQEETLVAATNSQQDNRLLPLVEKLVNWMEMLEKMSKESHRGVHPQLARMEANYPARGAQHTYSHTC